MLSRKKTITVKFLSENLLSLSGKALIDVRDILKDIAKKLDLSYRYNEEKQQWEIEGSKDKLLSFLHEFQKEIEEKGLIIVREEEIEEEKTMRKPVIIYEENLLELLSRELGFDINTVGVLYGKALVGKTRFSIKLAKALANELGLKPRFLVTEINWFFKHKGKSFYDIAIEEFGKESVYFCKTSKELISNLLKILDKDVFIVVDSVGAISQSFLAKYVLEKGEEESIVVTPRVIPFVNAITYTIAVNCIEKGATALLIAHEQELINRKFFMEDTKPSFGSRALHSCTYIWRMYEDSRGRLKLKCIVHRGIKELKGKEIEIRI